MAARRRRRTSHHRPAPISPTSPPWWLAASTESCFEREQSASQSEPPLFSGLTHRPAAPRRADGASTRGEGWATPSSPRAQRSMDLIRALVEAGRYEFGAHVESHMIEEGFDKEHCVGAVLGGRVLEVYVPPQRRREQERLLVAGRFHLSQRNTCPLHVVCELFEAPAPRPKPNTAHVAMEERVRFVTAYIPRLPEWVSPHVRASRA